MTFILWPHHC